MQGILSPFENAVFHSFRCFLSPFLVRFQATHVMCPMCEQGKPDGIAICTDCYGKLEAERNYVSPAQKYPVRQSPLWNMKRIDIAYVPVHMR